ncbi:hypothetical protein P40_03425 [Alloalcanivorax xenomutans]|nr:hypothetical protein P40_03425 [Alloalcanivorax xenomutans]
MKLRVFAWRAIAKFPRFWRSESMHIFIEVWMLYQWLGTPPGRFYDKPLKIDAKRGGGIAERQAIKELRCLLFQ